MLVPVEKRPLARLVQPGTNRGGERNKDCKTNHKAHRQIEEASQQHSSERRGTGLCSGIPNNLPSFLRGFRYKIHRRTRHCLTINRLQKTGNAHDSFMWQAISKVSGF